VVEVHATGTGADNDVAAWAKSTGMNLLSDAVENGVYKFLDQEGIRLG
jgi:TusA-related sulfurtransferase